MVILQIAIPGADMIGGLTNQMAGVVWLLFLGILGLVMLGLFVAALWLWRSNKIPWLRVWQFQIFHFVIRQNSLVCINIDKGAKLIGKDGTIIEMDKAKKTIPDLEGKYFITWMGKPAIFLLENPAGVYQPILPNLDGFKPVATAGTLIGWRSIERAILERTTDQNPMLKYAPILLTVFTLFIIIIGLVIYMGKLGELVDKLSGYASAITEAIKAGKGICGG